VTTCVVWRVGGQKASYPEFCVACEFVLLGGAAVMTGAARTMARADRKANVPPALWQWSCRRAEPIGRGCRKMCFRWQFTCSGFTCRPRSRFAPGDGRRGAADLHRRNSRSRLTELERATDEDGACFGSEMADMLAERVPARERNSGEM
jgi:hypothetical protein